jgi:hypothetical protein
VENPFLKPAKISVPPTVKPIFVGEKKAPSRFINESVGKVQSERKPLTTVEKGPKVIEQKRITENPGKKTISETAQNRVVGVVQPNRQINSSQGNSVKKDSTPIPTGEKVKGENKVLNPEGNKNRNVPVIPPVTVKTVNAKEPKYSQAVSERNASRTINQDRSGKIEQSSSNKENLGQRNLISLPPNDVTKVKSPNPVAQNPQRNASVNVNQSRSERAAQPNAQPTRSSQVQPLSQSQQGKAFVGRPSLPEVRSSSAPVSKGQAVESNRGSTGGLLGSSPLKSFH